MSAFVPMASIGAVGTAPIALQLGGPVATASSAQSVTGGFAQMLMRGAEAVSAKVDKADALVRRFAVDDSVPVHQVTMALEEARLSVELAMQARGRLLEGYRELMNMQL